MIGKLARSDTGQGAASTWRFDAEYPSLEIPSALRRAVASALQHGETHYTPVSGVEQLRVELASALAARGAPADADSILITAGEQEARFLALQALRRAQLTIALPAVVHPGARQAADVLSGPTLTIAVDPQRLTVTPDGVAAAIEAGAGAIYLESPSRLSGAAIASEDMARIVALCEQAGAWLVWDAGLTGWLPPSTDPPPSAHSGQTLTFGMPWPTLGLEAWSPGYLIAPPAMLDECRSIKQVISICTNTITQWSGSGGAAVHAAEHAARLSTLGQRRSQAAEAAAAAGLTAIAGEALAGLALRVSPSQRAALDASGLRYTDGASYGAPDVIRLTIAPNGSTAQALRSLDTQEL